MIQEKKQERYGKELNKTQVGSKKISWAKINNR